MAIQAAICEFPSMYIVRKVKMIIQIFDTYLYILEIYKHRAHSVNLNRGELMEESYYMMFFSSKMKFQPHQSKIYPTRTEKTTKNVG